MRIIAGLLKGRKILTNANCDYRPTTGKVKEAIFSILISGSFADFNIIKKANDLDVFAGTGALSFEAISRGANFALLVDNNRKNLQFLNENITKLGLVNEAKSFHADALNMPKTDKAYNLIFLDPPFNKNYTQRTITSLRVNGWIDKKAILVIETHRNEKYDLGNEFKNLLSRNYGPAILQIFQYIG
jgi:16S rRNA (guanine966-N2)-methyltransferase